MDANRENRNRVQFVLVRRVWLQPHLEDLEEEKEAQLQGGLAAILGFMYFSTSTDKSSAKALRSMCTASDSLSFRA